jgi:hypothetical protein
MVAALQCPPDEYIPRRAVPTRSAPARVIPLHPRDLSPRDVHPRDVHPRDVERVPVLRQPSPRAARSHGAAVYWRRRLFAAALGLGVLLTAAHAGAALGGTTTTAPERSPHVERVIVHDGDTLWTIAQRLAPHSDPRAVVDRLASELGSADLQPGEVIRWSK